MNFIEQQLEIAYNFADYFTPDNRNKLLDTKLVQSKLSQLYKNEEIADFSNKEYLSKKLGRKYKCCILRMLPVVFKLYSQYTKYLPIQLSTTSNNLLDIYINKSNFYNNNTSIYNLSLVDTFGEFINFSYNHRDISRIFDDLQTLGAMIEVDESYTFGHSYINDISKTYILSGKLLKDILSLSNININSINTIIYSNTNNNNSNLSLVDTFDSWSKKDIELYNKSKKIIDRCLQKQSSLPIDCQYSLSKDGSLRPYANICSQWKSLEKFCKKNDISENEARTLQENQGIEWREDYMDKYFGKGNWIEFDRNASIYNVSLLFNKGIYRPNNSTDLYQEFKGSEFINKKERMDFKLLNMSLYFGDLRKLKSFYEHMSSTAGLWLKYQENKKLSVSEQKTICHFLNNKERFAALLHFSNCYNNAKSWEQGWELVKEWYKKTRKNMVHIIGKPHKKTIFMIEAAINLSVAEKIRDLGFQVLEVYDGFFTNCKDTNLLENIYKDTAIEIINKIKKGE